MHPSVQSPFLEVLVVPAYGKQDANIIWKMRPGYESGNFEVLKSLDGLNDWKVIGDVQDRSVFVDHDLITDGKLELNYFQVLRRFKGQTDSSSVVSTNGALTRQEFGAAYFIMQQEYLKLSTCTKILVCKLRLSAKPCPACVDQRTGQKTGVTLCQTCFGTALDGGYWPPVISYMQLITQSPKTRLDSAEGAGSTDPVSCKARMLAFPALIKDDLIIDPAGDRRYLVEEQDISYLKGKAPLVAMSDLVMLRRNDVRYQFPISIE